MSALDKLASIPTRLYEYLALVALLTAGWFWFIWQHDAALKKDWLEDINTNQAKVEAKIDKLAVPQNAAIDARYNALSEVLKNYETTPIPALPADCVAPADLVRAVNAAHKAGR